ncbi:alpha/beta hydrolase [Mycobacterium sp. MYCO198283]|uniref:alpha/beta hydrolase n=1 Tax=Mycobacterium sp. MYCO198283 TaxID=2883505 RepID=UPI001E406E4E|nr:alpha/beta hydrolase [Mycobacterium sp. MYCO198283]MCG5432024.1 alpha/beta hydrolase [Mycobacterium sp. MYCO198283]
MHTAHPGLPGSPTLRERADWWASAGPSDYIIALTRAYASLPVVGKHFEPLGGLAAFGIWGYKNLPDFVAAAVHAKLQPGRSELRAQDRAKTNEVAAEALAELIPTDRLPTRWPSPGRKAPLWRSAQYKRQYLHRSSVRYGPAATQELDVWRKKELPDTPAPVMIFVPGGAWVHGSRMLQGYALMAHLAAQGWICLSIEYRVSPHHRWPRHIEDVKAAIAWARANVDQFGGDRNFVTIAGCSAGGHLAALAGLTPDEPQWQRELAADADTSVDAVVGIYGRYDWEDRSTKERQGFVDFLERVVVGRRIEKHPAVFRDASPIARVRPDAPPFLVVHGSGDTVIPVPQARSFVSTLRSVSSSPVGYIELPGAGHGFDMTDGVRTAAAATAITAFLNEMHLAHTAQQRIRQTG